MMRIIRKIQQIASDHRAMNLVRVHNGDIHLIACSTVNGNMFQCVPWQRERCSIVKKDPADAIIGAVTLAEFVTGDYGRVTGD